MKLFPIPYICEQILPLGRWRAVNRFHLGFTELFLIAAIVAMILLSGCQSPVSVDFPSGLSEADSMRIVFYVEN
jgi:hypothetical protein